MTWVWKLGSLFWAVVGGASVFLLLALDILAGDDEFADDLTDMFARREARMKARETALDRWKKD